MLKNLLACWMTFFQNPQEEEYDYVELWRQKMNNIPGLPKVLCYEKCKYFSDNTELPCAVNPFYVRGECTEYEKE